MYGCGCDSCTLPPFKGCLPVFVPKQVVYSPVVCRCCAGRTVEVEPGVRRIGTDERHGRFGQPWVRVTSYRFWCDGCGVVTWRKNR